MADTTEGTRASGPSVGRGRRRRPVTRWVLLTMLVLALTVAVCAVLMIRDAWTAREALEDAAAQIPAVEQALREDLLEETEQSLTEAPELVALQEHTATARTSTDGMLWDAASHLPGIGPSVSAVQTVASALDDLSAEVLPALAAAGDAAAATRRDDEGRLELEPLADSAEEVSAASTVIDEAQASVGAIDTGMILPDLVEPLTTFDERLGDLASLTETAERATTLLPPMLGADEPRQYLLLSLNNAELRTAGGIAGAMTLLGVDDGRVTIEQQASTQDLSVFPEPVVPLDPEEIEAYTPRLARFVQDVTLTPEFPRSGEIAAAMWADAQGVDVDGVIATDPVALSFLLEATGPVQVPLPDEVAAAVGSEMIEVSSENVVDLLLRRVYDAMRPEVADEFFAAVASTVFTNLVGSDSPPTEVLPAFERAAAEHRLLVWSALPSEQELLTGTLMAGSFASEASADSTGVFFDDTRSGKMTAYLEVQTDLAGSECVADHRLDTVEVTLTNTLDRATADTLPDYVAGPAEASGRGEIRINVTGAGVIDGAAPELAQDDAVVGGARHVVYGRENAVIGVTLRPEESTTIRLAFPSSSRAARGEGSSGPGVLEVWSTPTASTSGLHLFDVPTCG